MGQVFAQQDRRDRIYTILEDDALNLVVLSGEEELSGSFTWRIEVLSDDASVDVNTLLGTHATVEVKVQGGSRFFDGIVTKVDCIGMEKNGNIYELTLQPWLFVAGLRRNQRIFHNLSVDDILAELFQSYDNLGAPLYEMNLTSDYPVLEYTVQYGESDAAFATRLMERFGITWSWKHSLGNHTLYLTDSIVGHEDVAGGERPFYGQQRHHLGEEEHFREWIGTGRMTTGAVVLTEYNFKNPHAQQKVDAAPVALYANGEIESFDWPGDYLDQDEGRDVVSRRIERELGQRERIRAKGDVGSLAAGLCVTLIGNEQPGYTGKRFICLKAVHKFRAQSYGSTAEVSDEEPYEGTYVLMPTLTPLRPKRRTKEPRIYGPQTAKVVGDGEIDCDEHGRILVQFHWDMSGARSMRCRVSQSWASKGWGGMVIPRIGMEVLVEFLEGDPDKPIVTGCVYNGHNTPPYTLPDHKTRATFRSESHGGSGFNELRFEDESGEEEIFLHAQKYLNAQIGNNETWSTGGAQHRSIGGDQSLAVGGDRDIQVGGDQNQEVGGDVSLTLAGDLIDEVGGDMSLAVGGDNLVQTGGDIDLCAGGDMRLEGGMNFHAAGGMNGLIEAGIGVVISAGATLSLKAGASFITLDPSGVSISGPLVRINSGGAAGSGSSVTRKRPARPKKYAGPHATRYDKSYQS